MMRPSLANAQTASGSERIRASERILDALTTPPFSTDFAVVGGISVMKRKARKGESATSSLEYV